MRYSKRKRKGTKVKKLANGGNGDPPKGDPPYVSQAYGGFPLYKEFGELTPTPTSEFYTKAEERGYYEGLPLLLPEAEVVAESTNPFDLSSIDNVVRQTGAGVLGDYANIPADVREAYEAQVTQGINEGAVLAAVGMSPLLAMGAGPVLARGLAGWSTISSLPLVSMEGAGLVTVGQAVDLVGAGIAVEHAPKHVRDFIEEPSIGGGAWLGLDLLGLMMGGSAAKSIYTQSLRAGENLTTPMTFTSAVNLGDEAIIAGKLDEATVLFNRVVKDEISQIATSTKINAADKQAAIDEVLEFYSNYLNNPAALEKLVAQKQMLGGAKQVPMSPVIAEEASLQSYIYNKSTPYYSVFDDAGGRIGAHVDPATPIRSFTLTPTEVSPGVFEAKASVSYFSNTTPGRQAAAEALLENLRTGSESAKNAVLRAQEYLKQTYGYSARGIAKPQLNISGQVDMVDGVVIPEGGFSSFDLSAQQIEMLETLTPEQFVSTLIHETNHNMLTPFLNQMADLQIMEMHMIGATNRIPQFRNATRVADKSLAPGFHTADDMVSGIREVSAKYNNLHPEFSTGELDRHIMELLLPDEGIARLWEIKKAYSAQAAKQGMSFEDWMYKFTPEEAEKGLNAWRNGKQAGGEKFIEADLFLDLFQGSNTEEKLRSLTSALNETFTPLPVITTAGAAAVATDAVISDEETPTINKRGGFISKKKRRKGYRSI